MKSTNIPDDAPETKVKEPVEDAKPQVDEKVCKAIKENDLIAFQNLLDNGTTFSVEIVQEIFNTKRFNFIKYVIEKNICEIEFENGIFLGLACVIGDMDLVQWLVNRKADIHKNDDAIIDVLMHYNHFHITQYIKRLYEIETEEMLDNDVDKLLMDSIDNNDTEKAINAINRGADINKPELFETACMKGNHAIASHLINSGLIINFNVAFYLEKRNKNGWHNHPIKLTADQKKSLTKNLKKEMKNYKKEKATWDEFVENL